MTTPPVGGSTPKTYAVDDRVYRYWDSGAMGAEIQPLTVVRVNRMSVTVRTDQGSEFRINPNDIVGYYTDDEPTKPEVGGSTPPRRCFCGGPEEQVYGHERGQGRHCRGKGEGGGSTPTPADDEHVWVAADWGTNEPRTIPLATLTEAQQYLDAVSDDDTIDARPLVISVGEYRASNAYRRRAKKAVEGDLVRAVAEFVDEPAPGQAVQVVDYLTRAMGHTSSALGVWQTRDLINSTPHARRAANTAVHSIDAAIRGLHEMRNRFSRRSMSTATRTGKDKADARARKVA